MGVPGASFGERLRRMAWIAERSNRPIAGCRRRLRASYLSFPGWPAVTTLRERLRAVAAPGRRTLLLSLAGLFVLAVTAPKLLPVWSLKAATQSVVSQPAVVGTRTDVLAGLVFAVGYLRDALGTLEEEQGAVASERDAFLTFADDVETLSSAPRPTGSVAMADVTGGVNDERALKRVRERYRETVMALPDYEQEYGETLGEHLETEFGSDVASLVVEGGQFNEPLKRLLVEHSRQSAHQREQLLEMLAVENCSLREAESTLKPTAQFLDETDASTVRAASVTALVETNERIRCHQSRCESALENRQQEIHATNRQVGASETFLQEYLYSSLPVSFPVLYTVVEYIQLLEERRSALVRALCRRV